MSSSKSQVSRFLSDTSAELHPAVGVILMVIATIALGFLVGQVGPEVYSTENQNVPITFDSNYNAEANELTITYTGNNNVDVVYLSEEITVTYNGQETTWNGDTRGDSGALDLGSKHVIEGVSKNGGTVTVTINHPDYQTTERTITV